MQDRLDALSTVEKIAKMVKEARGRKEILVMHLEEKMVEMIQILEGLELCDKAIMLALCPDGKDQECEGAEKPLA